MPETEIAMFLQSTWRNCRTRTNKTRIFQREGTRDKPWSCATHCWPTVPQGAGVSGCWKPMGRRPPRPGRWLASASASPSPFSRPPPVPPIHSCNQWWSWRNLTPRATNQSAKSSQTSAHTDNYYSDSLKVFELQDLEYILNSKSNCTTNASKKKNHLAQYSISSGDSINHPSSCFSTLSWWFS